MSGEKTPDLESVTKQAAERYNDPAAINALTVELLETEIEGQGIRQEHAKALNPKLLGMVGDVRWMRWIIVTVAAIVPLVLLAFLLGYVYYYFPMLFGEGFGNEKVKAIRALSAPLTALIIGTFASFIVVYSALLVGIFRGAPEERNDKQEQGVASTAAQMAQKIGGGE